MAHAIRLQLDVIICGRFWEFSICKVYFSNRLIDFVQHKYRFSVRFDCSFKFKKMGIFYSDLTNFTNKAIFQEGLGRIKVSASRLLVFFYFFSPNNNIFPNWYLTDLFLQNSVRFRNCIKKVKRKQLGYPIFVISLSTSILEIKRFQVEYFIS
jgi:hypothetical protein